MNQPNSPTEENTPQENTAESELSCELPEFWQARYDSGVLPWDLEAVSPHFLQWYEAEQSAVTNLKTAPRMVVPGCGRGHDAAFFAKNGFQVTAVDYTEGAIKAIQELYADLVDQSLFPVQASIFDLPQQPKHLAYYDYLLEHTCFCAIHPKQREAYVEMAHQLLKPDGQVIGIFWEHPEWGGPPYSASLEVIESMFSPYFETISVTPMAEAVKERKGTEHLIVMKHKP